MEVLSLGQEPLSWVSMGSQASEARVSWVFEARVSWAFGARVSWAFEARVSWVSVATVCEA